MKDFEHLSPEHREIAESLVEYGYTSFKVIPNQGLCCLHRYFFTVGILTNLNLTDVYFGRYCYPSPLEAVKAFNTWNGEGDPSGNWVKYKGKDGERTNENYIE